MNDDLLAWIKEYHAALAAGDKAQAKVAFGEISRINTEANAADTPGPSDPDLGTMGAARIGVAEGLGGTAGALIGGAAGSVLPGPGTIAGGLTGGVLGAAAMKRLAKMLSRAPASDVEEQWNTTTEAHPLARGAAGLATAAVPVTALSKVPQALRAVAKGLPAGVGGNMLRNRAAVQELTPLAKIAALQKEIDAGKKAAAELARQPLLTRTAAAKAARAEAEAAELARRAAHPEKAATSTAKHKTIQTQAEIAEEELRIKRAMADAAEANAATLKRFAGGGRSPEGEAMLQRMRGTPGGRVAPAREGLLGRGEPTPAQLASRKPPTPPNDPRGRGRPPSEYGKPPSGLLGSDPATMGLLGTVPLPMVVQYLLMQRAKQRRS